MYSPTAVVPARPAPPPTDVRAPPTRGAAVSLSILQRLAGKSGGARAQACRADKGAWRARRGSGEAVGLEMRRLAVAPHTFLGRRRGRARAARAAARVATQIFDKHGNAHIRRASSSSLRPAGSSHPTFTSVRTLFILRTFVCAVPTCCFRFAAASVAQHENENVLLLRPLCVFAPHGRCCAEPPADGEQRRHPRRFYRLFRRTWARGGVWVASRSGYF